MANVIFKVGTKAQYNALETKDTNTLYWLTDVLELYKGEALYGTGAEATNLASGLMSAADKAKLDTITVDENGLVGVDAIPIEKVTGLTDELARIEQTAVGGVHYRGSVATTDDLPADAEQGDLYEVTADNSEWCFNGTEWFEYGSTSDIDLSAYATKSEVSALTERVAYEVTSAPTGTLVNYTDEEVRIMCPADTAWTFQNSGEGSDPNRYYIGLKAYAPSEDVVGFKEDMAETISDETMYSFENNEFAGVDEYGRKYSILWLAAAKYDEETSTWSYFGANSSAGKYIGWYYSVEWYNATGVKVAADTIRISLSNEGCHTTPEPYYIGKVNEALNALGAGLEWGNLDDAESAAE